jgi:hypothetical protein
MLQKLMVKSFAMILDLGGWGAVKIVMGAAPEVGRVFVTTARKMIF